MEYWNAGKDLYIFALNIKKAFDTVKTQCLKEVLIGLNVPTRLIDRVLVCIKDEITRILWEGQLSNESKRGKGIKQGCPLSPSLFNYLIQSVLSKVEKEIPELELLGLGRLKLPIILAFADDIIIIARSKEELERILKILYEQLGTVGLEINFEKCQIIIRKPNDKAQSPKEITLNGINYKVFDQIKYLGVTLTSTLNRKSTNRQRCLNAFRASQIVVEFCKKFRPKWEIGKLIYKTVLSPSLTYGTKVDVFTKKSRVSTGNYEKLILKNIFNFCRKPDNLKYNARKLLDGKTINRKIRTGRLRYYGHILRREREHPLRKALQLKLDKKKEGRPSLTWTDSLEQDKKDIKI